MRWIIALFLYSLLTVPASWGADIGLQIGMHHISAAIANTPQSRERGLMEQTQLCTNCGMLFVFPNAAKHAFWMKNTPLPLSIAFIAADGRILNLTEMKANSTHIHRAQGNALFALEMKKGWFAEHSIKPADRVTGLQKVPRGE